MDRPLDLEVSYLVWEVEVRQTEFGTMSFRKQPPGDKYRLHAVTRIAGLLIEKKLKLTREAFLGWRSFLCFSEMRHDRWKCSLRGDDRAILFDFAIC